jgi:hypothetical protein
MHEVTNAELSRSLVRIEGKLDNVTSDHEGRLRRIERMVYIAIGLGSAGTASGVVQVVATAAGGP